MRTRHFAGLLMLLSLLLSCEKQPDTVSVTGITLDRTTVELIDGESITLTATVTPKDAANKEVRWSCGHSNIQVTNGKVTTSFKPGTKTTTINGKEALGQGTITATTVDGNKKATCKVIVYAKTIAVTGLRLSETSLHLNKGEEHMLKATIQPGDATEKSVQWTSSDPSVVSVSQDGLVTAVGGGKATITASAGGISATCSVDVNVPATSISLNAGLLSLAKGTSAVLTATVLPDDAMDKTVRWSSDNPAVASVDQNGKVTAVEVGRAKITASVGDVSASCSVLCIAVPVSAVVLDKTSLSLAKGSAETLTATVSPADATDKTVRWSSDNPSVASVDQHGLVTAVNTGEATITAAAGDISATCTISVFVPVTSVTLNPANLTLMVGETATLEVSVLPDDATDKDVMWYSSDPNVALVEVGSITAVSFGEAVITAQVGNQSASCALTVLADSSSGVTAFYSGGNVQINDGLILAGSRLDFGVSNYSTETITVKTVQLVDGESGSGSESIDINRPLEAGDTLPWSIDVPAAGIHSPTAIFTFIYLGEEYSCSATYFEPIEQSIHLRD